ncbi:MULTISPECIES: LLM class flavin-dependent oxidoreductase [unclassified Aeromicrobium]|uniref:LLM class flavin-dependent oxidoreductase n=1 Tax=unclassified Aeromicrobium TaxID=2633570 RepID=UPI00396B1A25
MKLSVFDLNPVSDGTTGAEALRAVVDLARNAEDWGFHGYWFGEHHLGRGRVGSAPVVLTSLVASRTRTLHVGTAVAVLPHYRPLSLVEQVGTIAELFPGRIHLGLGKGLTHAVEPTPARVTAAIAALADPDREPPELERGDHPTLLRELLVSSPSDAEGYDTSVRQVLSLLRRPIATVDGQPVQASPGLGAPVRPWLFGSSGVPSALRSAALGLPFVVNHHVIDESLTEAVTAYRDAFTPSVHLDRPHVAVSVHAVAADTDRQAQEAARSYRAWISGVLTRGFSDVVHAPDHSIHDDPSARHEKSDGPVGTRIVGTGEEVADRIAEFSTALGADEVLVNTIVHGDKVKARSFELIAEHWAART